MTKAQLLDDARSLSPADRIDLAMDLWDSLQPSDTSAAISPVLREELLGRVTADEANPQQPKDWNALRMKLLRGEI